MDALAIFKVFVNLAEKTKDLEKKRLLLEIAAAFLDEWFK